MLKSGSKIERSKSDRVDMDFGYALSYAISDITQNHESYIGYWKAH
jgi:hypothetical protein